MLLLRLFLILSALLIALSGGAYLFTRKPTYLRLAWQLVHLVGVVLLVFGILYLLERFVLVGWRILV